jgi:GMP synthase (glutamine-hydrolysing)
LNVLVLQHVACEPPGVFEDVLVERGATIHRVELDEGEQLPDWHGYDVIVAMGGPMSAYDDDELPWLTHEKRLIADAVRAGTPFFGVCLGVQLLAASLGARVYAGAAPEVGVLPVELTAEGRTDPVLACLPDGAMTLQWHGDTFDLPDGAVLLARSPAFPHQAFRYANAYGVQFHLEVSDEMVREWFELPEYAASLARSHGPDAAAAFVSSIEERSGEMRASGRQIFECFLDSVVAPARAGAVAT